MNITIKKQLYNSQDIEWVSEGERERDVQVGIPEFHTLWINFNNQSSVIG